MAGLSIGIIVDDTVHFLSKYTHARQVKRLDATEAVRYAFRTVGTAILGTTFVVAVLLLYSKALGSRTANLASDSDPAAMLAKSRRATLEAKWAQRRAHADAELRPELEFTVEFGNLALLVGQIRCGFANALTRLRCFPPSAGRGPGSAPSHPGPFPSTSPGAG